MTPEEVHDDLRFVAICERGGGTPAEEADEWRRRIQAWQGSLVVGGWLDGLTERIRSPSIATYAAPAEF
jgi:hypothetical protein